MLIGGRSWGFDLRQYRRLPGGHADAMFKHILIPTDGSEVAAKAIQAGVELAAGIGAGVTGFYAIEPAPMHLYGEGYQLNPKAVEEMEKRSRDFAQKSVDAIALAAKAAGVKCKTVIGKAVLPYRGIIDAAAKGRCDAICMASNGHRGLTGLLLGSVTHEVLTHSKIPVLVVR
jgi:nucleotide-binding universal stress UspA family protein